MSAQDLRSFQKISKTPNYFFRADGTDTGPWHVSDTCPQPKILALPSYMTSSTHHNWDKEDLVSIIYSTKFLLYKLSVAMVLPVMLHITHIITTFSRKAGGLQVNIKSTELRSRAEV